MITTLNFKQTNDPDILEVINTLAELENRKPHDAARLLILEAGKTKIEKLKTLRDENANSSMKSVEQIAQVNQNSSMFQPANGAG